MNNFITTCIDLTHISLAAKCMHASGNTSWERCILRVSNERAAMKFSRDGDFMKNFIILKEIAK